MGLIVRAELKKIAEQFSIAGDFGDAFEEKAKNLLKDAMGRATANGRKTLMAKDL